MWLIVEIVIVGGQQRDRKVESRVKLKICRIVHDFVFMGVDHTRS